MTMQAGYWAGSVIGVDQGSFRLKRRRWMHADAFPHAQGGLQGVEKAYILAMHVWKKNSANLPSLPNFAFWRAR